MRINQEQNNRKLTKNLSNETMVSAKELVEDSKAAIKFEVTQLVRRQYSVEHRQSTKKDVWKSKILTLKQHLFLDQFVGTYIQLKKECWIVKEEQSSQHIVCKKSDKVKILLHITIFICQDNVLINVILQQAFINLPSSEQYEFVTIFCRNEILDLVVFNFYFNKKYILMKVKNELKVSFIGFIQKKTTSQRVIICGDFNCSNVEFEGFLEYYGSEGQNNKWSNLNIIIGCCIY
ncbi:unnamed protein product [Paramecium octaurelia]|uniref:Endonuclease/exonuclease/phosphatase domain-containing protein n=1 Tax=Paramecium octaurelia TaxID=43137 RepID=A0A8S1WCU1_PAROT|nr:unnamed protein product [Paramecium octaurelia]